MDRIPLLLFILCITIYFFNCKDRSKAHNGPLILLAQLNNCEKQLSVSEYVYPSARKLVLSWCKKQVFT